MHKMIKKTLKYLGITLLAFVFILVAIVSYLYHTADMLTPQMVASSPNGVVQKCDSLRSFGDNHLRHSCSGLWELTVRGDAFHRGEAIGHLSKDLLYYQEKVFVNQIKEIVPSERYLSFLRFFTVLFNRNLGRNIPEEYRKEIYGISLSCTHEYDFIGTPYERQLNYHSAHDLGHAMQDYMLVGCSSFATWGKNSADKSLIIGRNFDFYVGDEFARNKQIAFYFPDKGYKFASVGWPGMIGVMSGMNEAGLTVTINAAKSTMPTSSATPISILTREILQYASTIDEAYTIAKSRKTFVAESILIGSAKDGRAAIIEKSPDKIDLYTGDGQQIICTNHYQSKAFANDKGNIENIKTSDSPYRYARIKELLRKNSPMDESKAASVLRNHLGLNDRNIGLANEMALNQFIAHHSVIFKPQQLTIWISTSPWQCGKYVAYDLNKIFKGEVDYKKEINNEALTIPEDTFLKTKEYSQLLSYKKMTKQIRKQIQAKTRIAENVLARYQVSNPEMYYVYEVLGDYYHSQNKQSKAVSCWKKALTKAIPKQAERKRIEDKLTIN